MSTTGNNAAVANDSVITVEILLKGIRMDVALSQITEKQRNAIIAMPVKMMENPHTHVISLKLVDGGWLNLMATSK